MSDEYKSKRVYVTRPGETYHTARDCSTLSCAPYVEATRISELEKERSPCKICTGEHTISTGLCSVLEDMDPKEVE